MLNVKSTLQRLKSKSILIKLMLSFAGTSILSVLIVAIIFSYWFSRENTADINNMSRLVLSNFCLTVSNVFESSGKAAYDIYKTPYFRKLTSPGEVMKEDLLDSLSYLNNILVSNSNIYSIYICNSESIVLDVGSKYEFSEDYSSISSLIKNSPVLKPLPRTIKNNNGDILELYSFIYHEPALYNNSSPSVIINLKARELNKQVFSKFLNPKQDIIVASNTGSILMNRDMSMLTKDISKEPYFKNALAIKTEWGYFNTNFNSISSVINFYSFDNNKYIAFMISDYNDLFQKIAQFRNAIVLICLLVFVVIFILSLYISYSLYSPINNVFSNVRRFVGSQNKDSTKENDSGIKYISNSVTNLIEKLNSLEQDKLGNFHIVRNNFINEIFLAEKHITDETLLEGLENYNLIKSSKDIHVITVFRVGNYNAFSTGNSLSSIEFQLGSMENIALQIFTPVFECSTCRINTEHFILIINVPEPQANNYFRIEQEIANIAREVQKTIFQLFSLEITVGISQLLTDLNILDIREKYNQAFNLTNYRLVYGRTSVFTKDNVKFDDVKNDKITTCLDSIVNSIKASSLDEYKSQIKNLFLQVKSCKYDRIIKIFFQLMESIQQVFSNLRNIPASNDQASPESLYNTLKYFEDYEELENFFIDLFYKTTDVILNIKNSKTQDQIGNVSEYIKQNYNKPDLSANLMAEKLAVSPQYFSKIFKDFTGYSFPDYVHNIRMEKAKELIVSDKQLTISEICEKVGYNNKPYFTNSFTKKYGISPTKYRQINKSDI